MKKIIAISIVLALSSCLYRTHHTDYVESTEKSNMVIRNKNIPSIIEAPIKEALSHYPELADTRIDFVFRENIKKSFMQAQPRWYGIFQRKKNRSYVIQMTPVMMLNNQSIPIEEIPHQVIVGWIGHELGHVMDYNHRMGVGLVAFGIGYVTSSRYKTGAEHMADIYAISHGLGSQILATKEFILDNAHIDKTYKNKIKSFYMSPEEVLERIQQNESLSMD